MGLPMGSLLSNGCPLDLLWGTPCNRKPNAKAHLLPEAGAQRTLEAVSCRPMLGNVLALAFRYWGWA